MTTIKSQRQSTLFATLLLACCAILPMGCEQIGAAKNTLVEHFQTHEVPLLQQLNPFNLLSKKPDKEAIVMAPVDETTFTDQLPWIVRAAADDLPTPPVQEFAIADPPHQTSPASTETTPTIHTLETHDVSPAPTFQPTPRPSSNFTPTTPTTPATPATITTQNLYAGFEALNLHADQLLAKHEITTPQFPIAIESELDSTHIYQIALQCAAQLKNANQQFNSPQMPTLAAIPGLYQPRDVQIVIDLMQHNLRQLDPAVQIDSENRATTYQSDTTPTQVFNLAAQVLVKFAALADHPITASDLTVQFTRITVDAKALLRFANPNSAYRVDAPISQPGRSTADVYSQTLAFRTLLHNVQIQLDIDTPAYTPPLFSSDITHADTFIQTTIALADLNRLKHATGATAITPLLTTSSRATSTDAHQQASMAKYLFSQLKLDQIKAIPHVAEAR